MVVVHGVGQWHCQSEEMVAIVKNSKRSRQRVGERVFGLFSNTALSEFILNKKTSQSLQMSAGHCHLLSTF